MTLNDVPLASQTLGLTQPLIRSNFTSIDTAFAVDHVGYNLTNAGKHAKVTFPFLPAPNPMSWLTNEIGLYNAAGSFGNALFAHITTLAGNKEVPFTQSSLQTSTPTQAVGGWTQLPSGMIFISGSGNGAGNVLVTITSPSITQILGVIVCPFASATSDVDLAVRLMAIGSSSPSSAPLLTNQFRIYVSTRTFLGPVNGGFSFLALAF